MRAANFAVRYGEDDRDINYLSR